ncbi:XrtA system polysaccharide chain length determinant [Candidatus Methylomicrobium oryzae]|uniref:XrtA system polysaccharide chain length determinant n=1 Tax=Candidatus Methylomicrobium oryzae TaxID=2802053 RepID=UPI001921D591|nr:XrtA system polysaccharide chain length determinant [Methylomicrobium sp. RS1]MBL1264961.1 hypothetical protein [Methylomicrobium sp. RS1]
MQEQITELFYYARGAVKYKWVGLITAWIICSGGWMFISAMPNKFSSEAKVHVETRTMLLPLLRGMTIQTDTAALLRIMQKLMFTQNNLEEIIKLSELDKYSGKANRLELIDKLKKDIKIEGGRDDIFTITYEATSGTLAKNVVQAVLTVFSDQTHKSTLSGTDSAKRFINDQIHEYEIRLRNAEKAKENFKRANLGLLPGEGGGQIADVQKEKALLEEAKLQLIEAKSRYQATTEQLADLQASGGEDEWAISDVSENPTEEDARIEDLASRKKELLIRFTENHPEIISINKVIKHLKKTKETTEKENVNTEEDIFNKPNVIANPYIQSIKIAQNEANAQVASSQARVDELQARLLKIENELQNRLRVETDLQNLNRDYEAIKSKYNLLIESREQAVMSEKVDDQAEALKFKIADAPNVPLTPSSPKRGLLYSIVFLAGPLLGTGLAILMYFLRPSLVSTSQLKQLTGLPILGSVSLKSNSAQTKLNKKQFIRFYGSLLGLLLIYSALMTFEMMGKSLSNILGS